MPQDMKVWQVRHAAHDVLWDFRVIASALEHAMDPWSGVVAVVRNSPAEVQNERVRCTNIISGACGRLIRFLNIQCGRKERYDPDAVLEELIRYLDTAMADLKVSRVRQVLEHIARDNRPD
jgi:hypothetical protein